MKDFSKIEFFGAVGVALLGGMAIGYSKARETFLAAMIKAMPDKDKEESKTEEES